MRRYRLSRLAENDVSDILVMSEDRWGTMARRRYAALISSAMRRVAADPSGPATQNRTELLAGLRSFHIRFARTNDPDASVRNPVHVLYYRAVAPDLVEIVRVLHERMEPNRHLSVGNTE